MAPEKILCRIWTEAIGGREDLAMGKDQQFEVKLSTQPVLRGAGDDGINPEQLYVGSADHFRQKWQKT